MSPPLPIRRVVLYKHGVAYLERRGEVEGAPAASGGGAAVHLDFKARDMNDVLKSLTVLDLSPDGGGAVSAVSYDSVKPLAKLLEEATIRLPEEGSLTALLGQVKGARVRLRLASETVEGVLLGLERLQVGQGEVVVERPFVSVLVDGAVRTVDVLEVRELLFLDEAVRRDLEFYLATVLSSYRKDSKRLAILTRGEGRRRLFVSYVVEAPVWKTSYRLLLPAPAAEGSATGEATAEAPPPPLLQGWAVVDNTGDEDWRDVELALVAGLPVSFVHDLYSPRYLRRPEVRVQTETGVLPVVPEEGMGYGAAAAAMMEAGPAEDGMAAMGAAAVAVAGPPARSRASRAAPKALAAPAPSLHRMAQTQGGGAPVQTLTREVGDLFEYRVERPVTVLRNQSALVPILQRPVEGRRVLLWNRQTRERNPMACLELTNTTGLTLEGGPATVIEGDSYVGEAMLDTLRPGDTRLVPYAVELGCLVSVEDHTEGGEVHAVRVAQGVLVAEFFHLRTTHYRVKLKGPRPASLVLEHPRGAGWELVDTAAPAETTEGHLRFRLALTGGGEEQAFRVRERTPGTREWHLGGVGPEDVALLLRSRFIDEAFAASLRGLLALKARVAEVQALGGRLRREREGIREEQGHLRANLEALRGASAQREADRLVARLSSQEDRLEAISAELSRLEGEQARLEGELREGLGALAFSRHVGAPPSGG
jgi:hypothetical protein